MSKSVNNVLCEPSMWKIYCRFVGLCELQYTFLMMMLTQSNGDTKSFVEICEPDSYPGHLIPKKGHVWNVQKYVFKANYKEKKPIDVKEIGGGKRQRHGNMLKY